MLRPKIRDGVRITWTVSSNVNGEYTAFKWLSVGLYLSFPKSGSLAAVAVRQPMPMLCVFGYSCSILLLFLLGSTEEAPVVGWTGQPTCMEGEGEGEGGEVCSPLVRACERLVVCGWCAGGVCVVCAWCARGVRVIGEC